MAKIRPEFYVNLQGKAHPTWPGVLIALHEEGLAGIEVTPLQYPTPENEMTAICQATVTLRGPDGRDLVFTEVGDACPKNVNARIATALLRMAATRAKGRAGRDAIACGETLAEEIPDNEEMERANGHPVAHGANPSRPQAPAAPRGHGSVPRHPPIPEPAAAAEAVCSVPDCGVVLTPDEVRSSHRHFGGVMCCTAHGRERLLAQRAEAEAAAA